MYGCGKVPDAHGHDIHHETQTKYGWCYKGLHYFVFKESLSCGFSGKHRDRKTFEEKENNCFYVSKVKLTSLVCSSVTLTCLQ